MRIYKKIWILTISLFCFACSDWLNIEQDGEFEADNLYSTGDGYRAVLNGLYKALGSAQLYGNNLSFGMLDCMSQQYELTSIVNEDPIFTAFTDFEYQDNKASVLIDGLWLAGFRVIANANDLIQHIEKTPANLFEFGEMERSLILGEAYACRALVHFDLLRLFAPAFVNDDKATYVPYVKVYPNIYAPSIKVEPFLENVIADLVNAKKHVAIYDTTETGKRMSASAATRCALSPSGNFEYGDFFSGRAYRLSYYSITALLARVYQYANKQEEAFKCAKEVLGYGADGEDLFYLDDFSGVKSGKEGSTVEAFSQKSDYKIKSNIIFAAYNKKGYEDWRLGVYFSPSTTGTENYYFPVKKVELFSSRGSDEWQNDYRSKYMLYTPNKKNFFVSGKWFVNTAYSMESEHLKISPIIRSTEMKYIIAEYHAKKGQYKEAYNILNEIRRDRGLTTELLIQNHFDEFITDLLEEARREWISEGQLFYLYKRLNAEFVKNGQKHKLSKSEACLPLPKDQK